MATNTLEEIAGEAGIKLKPHMLAIFSYSSGLATSHTNERPYAERRHTGSIQYKAFACKIKVRS